jgi:hypothetical protein
MRIIGGKFRSTVRAPNQLDIVKIEDWRSLQLDIQVRFPSHLTRTYLLVLISKLSESMVWCLL